MNASLLNFSVKKLLLKIYYLILESKSTFPQFYKNPFKKYDLVIYDTIFPNPISGFRYAEFSQYLAGYKHSKIVVKPSHYAVLGQSLADFDSDLSVLKDKQPTIYNKTFVINRVVNINCKLFYCVFYGAIINNIKILNRFNIPFIFTLYPGGGFNLKSEEIRENLRRICRSPNFRGVIVTQKITLDYLLRYKICTRNKIKYIYGGIVPQNSIEISKRYFYNINKETLDICFCAAKYMPEGKDKGYDIFIKTAQKISEKYPNAYFHIIGGFNEDDFPIGKIKDKCIFYGFKKYDELQKVFEKIDFIFSPNRPYMLGDGLFDGVPLGTVVEAGLNGVIPLITDELDQLEYFSEGEVFVCKPSVSSFYENFENVLTLDLREVSMNVQNKFREIYNNENQLAQRMSFLNQHIE